ncbi:Lrp/AsnC family transcriptional regulator [Gulosibacter bifidus]|uniref:Helix-turn-helix domain-containing protein n=1 Tax=Gulosibacter bifidus TaxID=272239 RepID=A0ABW5RIH8_9MICO|nr:Lrp/AsnC family transcriptional regulator [Gulosibacter bifidus]
MPTPHRQLINPLRTVVQESKRIERRVARHANHAATTGKLTQTEIANELGVSQSTVSRLIKRYNATKEDLSADNFVDAAYHGEITHEELLNLLRNHAYEPAYRVKGLLDDYEHHPNSDDAIYDAFYLDLISEDELDDLLTKM